MPMHNCMVMYVYLCVSNMHHFCVKCPFVACESRKIEHFFNNVNWGSCEKQKMSTLIRLIRWNVLWNVSHKKMSNFSRRVADASMWVTKMSTFSRRSVVAPYESRKMSTFSSCVSYKIWAISHAKKSGVERGTRTARYLENPKMHPPATVIRPDHPRYVRPAKGRLWPILYKRLKIVLQTADVVFLRGAVIFCFLHCVKSCRFSSNAIKTGSLSNKGRVYRTGVAWDCNQL